MPNMSDERAYAARVRGLARSSAIGTPNLLVLDIRSAVDGGGRAAFEQAHIPGAIHTDYAKDGWRAVKGMATGLLPDPADLKTLFARFGLLPSDHVVIVSAGTSAGDFCAAARVYWTLKIAGHAEMSILDGGMLAWQADAARPLEAGAGATAKAAPDYPVKVGPELRSDVAAVARAIESDDAVLLDTRATSFFRRREQVSASAARRPASGRGASRQRAGLRRRGQATQAALRIAGVVREGRGKAGGQLLQYRPSGRDHLVRAVGNPAAAGDAL